MLHLNPICHSKDSMDAWKTCMESSRNGPIQSSSPSIPISPRTFCTWWSSCVGWTVTSGYAISRFRYWRYSAAGQGSQPWRPGLGYLSGRWIYNMINHPAKSPVTVDNSSGQAWIFVEKLDLCCLVSLVRVCSFSKAALPWYMNLCPFGA